MGPGKRWLYLIAGLAAAFVAISVIVQAVAHHSWSPVGEAGWIPAVMVAVLPGVSSRGRCNGAGRRQAR
ncbi:MAG TPA: hypothetical protein VF482_11095 [Trebonia sp.]